MAMAMAMAMAALILFWPLFDLTAARRHPQETPEAATAATAQRCRLWTGLSGVEQDVRPI